MKKKILIALGILIGITILVLLIVFAGKKTKANSFDGILESKEFSINNVIKKYKDKTILRAYEAKKKDNKYSIIYLEFNSSSSADNYFNKEKKKLNDTKAKDAAINYSITNGLERYTINTSDNHYIVLSKKKNIIIYYDIDSKYSEEVINLVENELGY